MEGYPKAQSAQMNGYDAARQYSDQTYQYASTYSNSHDGSQVAQGQSSFGSQPVETYAPAVVSMQPTSGPLGTRIVIKVTSSYPITAGLVSITAGGAPCPTDVSHDPADPANMYTLSMDMPHLLRGQQQMGVSITSPDHVSTARLMCGTFSITGSISGASTKDSKSPVSPHTVVGKPAIPDVNAVNNVYESAPMPTTVGMGYSTPAYSAGSSTDMMGYRTGTFGESAYSRSGAQSMLRQPMGSWPQYGSQLDARHEMVRTSVATVGSTATNVPHIPPRLVRTSTIGGVMNGAGMASGINNLVYTARAELKIGQPMLEMATQWSNEEWACKRRIVRFKRHVDGSTINLTLQPTSPNDRSNAGVCVSCIWWEENQACYITSVDTIALLEYMLVAPARFTVEEKNRIRRNLEGFKPATVGKAKPDTEEFFKVIMGFANPRPRNIEKDVKVFPWKVLENSLKKIVNKYSLNPHYNGSLGPSDSMTASQIAPPLNPYPSVPSPPGATSAESAYTVHGSHSANGEASPRSMASSSNAWNSYTAATASPRTISPSFRATQSAGLQSIPSVNTLDSRPMAAVAATGQFVGSMHGPLPGQRWDPSQGATSQYETSVAHYGAPHHQVYTSASYGEPSGHR